MEGLLEGRNILVVGASSGVGLEFAEAARKAGAAVVATARRVDGLDVRSAEDCRAMVASALDAGRPIDLVMYAAGAARLAWASQATVEDWAATFDTNVLGLQQVLRAAVDETVPAGIIAVLSSETSVRPRVGLGLYGASKAAMDALVATWRIERPDRRFSSVLLGATTPSDFAVGWEWEVLKPALQHWGSSGVMQEATMESSEVAAFLVGAYAAALANPSVGVDSIVLRSPSAVVGAPELRPGGTAES